MTIKTEKKEGTAFLLKSRECSLILRTQREKTIEE
jgi:hypothetical protein